MNSENPIARKPRFKNPVLAALEICGRRRAQDGGLDNTFTGARHAIERTAAIVDAAAARLDAGDFSALQAVCASQVLALDVIFNEFARESAQWKSPSHTPMKMALKAQSQCRATVKALVSLQSPAGRALGEIAVPQKKSPNFDEQTIGRDNFPA